MKKEYYDSIGNVTVECGGSFIRYFNGYGSGRFEVYLFDSKKEFDEYIEDYLYGIGEKQYYLITEAYFKNAKVLDDECYYYIIDALLSHTLFVLNGRYLIYYDNLGNVYFVKWKED